MSSLLEKVLEYISSQAPQAPAAQLAAAVVSTVEAPNPETIYQDVEIGLAVFKEMKTKLAGVHPSVINFLKAFL